MMRLTKLALDAQKARAMAEAAGIIPQPGSAWKWALRNVRDGRGDLLTGRELAQAKENMGRLTNNELQRIRAINQKTGGRYEIGYVKGDPNYRSEARIKAEIQWEKDRDVALRQHLSNGGNEHTFAWNQSLKPYLERELQKYNTQFEQFVGQSQSDSLHQLFQKGLERKMQKGQQGLNNLSLERYSVGSEGGVSDHLLPKGTLTHGAEFAHTHPATKRIFHEQTIRQIAQNIQNGLNTPKQIAEMNYELNELSRLNHPVLAASPSGGHGTVSAGDTKVIRNNPNTNYPIVTPEKNIDAVHRARPQGTRSVYFKTEKGR